VKINNIIIGKTARYFIDKVIANQIVSADRVIPFIVNIGVVVPVKVEPYSGVTTIKNKEFIMVNITININKGFIDLNGILAIANNPIPTIKNVTNTLKSLNKNTDAVQIRSNKNFILPSIL
jgi:hypothetical protein